MLMIEKKEELIKVDLNLLQSFKNDSLFIYREKVFIYKEIVVLYSEKKQKERKDMKISLKSIEKWYK